MKITLQSIFHLSALFLSFAFFTFGCAEIELPSGGPIDKTAPKGLAAYPADGTLNYPGPAEFTFQFDEHIDERTIASALIITPRPSTPPEIRTRGKQVIIRLTDSLRSETTYMVALSPTVKDLRGNQLSEQVAIRFSTGSVIDTGRIAGRVLQEGKPVSGAVVVAYGYVAGKITGDTVKPVYRTISANDGQFLLDVLPKGEYVIAAFVDPDRDEIPNQLNEQLGVADRVVTVEANLPSPYVTIWVPAKGTILAPTARQIGNGLVRLSGIYGDIDSQKISVTMTESSRPTRYGLRQDRFVGTYLLELLSRDTGDMVITILQGIDTIALPIRLAEIDDTRSPEFSITQPSAAWGMRTPDTIQFDFSEPMDTTSAFSISGIGKDSLTLLQFRWINKYTALANPEDSVMPQRWKMSRPYPRDVAGNGIADTVLTIPYRIVAADSLGSISGAFLNVNDDSIWVRIFRINTPETTSFFLPNNRFDFQLPSGKYGLEAFADRIPTENGSWTPGSLRPFRLAEARYQFLDTLTVRARFEVTGLALRPYIPTMNRSQSSSTTRGNQ